MAVQEESTSRQYPREYSLPHQLVGMLDGSQVHEMAASGWGFNPDPQLWVKLFYAEDGAPETPAFLATIIESLVAQGVMEGGAYPGSAAETAAAAALGSPTERTGPWAKVTAALAASHREPGFDVGDDAPFDALFGDAMEAGMAVFLGADDDANLQQVCRDVHDWRVGWSNDDFARMDELSFVWDDMGQTGRVGDGLAAFDDYLQQRGSGKRLVAVANSADFHISFLVAEEHADDLIAGLAEQGYQAQRQSAPAVPTAAPAGGDAISGVTLRMERMPAGTPGQVPPMAPMEMSAMGTGMPGRLFSHEVGVMFVNGDGTMTTSDQVSAAGLDEDQLLELAVRNLVDKVGRFDVASMGGMRMLAGAGGLEACMALVPSLWDEHLASEFPNGPVIGLPAKDVLAAVDRADAEGIAGLRRSAAALLEQNPDSLLATELYERRADGTWVVFDESAPAEMPSTPAPPEKKRFWRRG